MNQPSYNQNDTPQGRIEQLEEERMMTALEIIKELKRDRGSVLWINHERRAAAFMRQSESWCVAVAYTDALIARTDPEFGLVEHLDGEVIAAT